MLCVVTLAAAALTAVAVVISGNNATTQARAVPVVSAAQMQRVLATIPQHDDTLGSPSAPVTLTEFADLQCPYCQSYMLTLFPYIIANYVIPGKVKIVWRGLAFIGPDSSTAGRAVLAAGEQDKLWNFADAFFYRQQRENTGYVTDAFLRSVASTVPHLNIRQILDRRSAQVMVTRMRSALALAKATGVKGTPGFIIARAGRSPVRVFGFTELTRSLNQALAR